MDKFNTRWEEGVYAGTIDESGERIIGTNKGFLKVGTVRRKGSEGERWNKEFFDKVQGPHGSLSQAGKG